MKLYADLPARRAAQVTADVLVAAWVVGCYLIGRLVHDSVLALLTSAQQLQQAGASFRGAMRQAGQAVSGVPLIGDRLAEPFDQAARAGAAVTDAGNRLSAAITHLANVLGVLTALVPALLVVAVWLVVRVRFARRAGSAQRLIDSAADLDLFALRALAHQPMHRLAAVSPDPSLAWRRGDAGVVRALALLELRDCGLRPPAAPTGSFG